MAEACRTHRERCSFAAELGVDHFTEADGRVECGWLDRGHGVLLSVIGERRGHATVVQVIHRVIPTVCRRQSMTRANCARVVRRCMSAAQETVTYVAHALQHLRQLKSG